MALPAEPTRQLITALQVALTAGVHVMGERPADLGDHLPAVVLTRAGGTALGSTQALLGDAPLISVDVYAIGLDAAYAQMRDARAALHGLGARETAGPLPTTDTDEAAGIRRVSAVWRFATH
jgi:hypothetical protein